MSHVILVTVKAVLRDLLCWHLVPTKAPMGEGGLKVSFAVSDSESLREAYVF